MLLAILFMLISMKVESQQESVIPYATLDDMLINFSKIQTDTQTKQFDKELEILVDQTCVNLNKWLYEQQKIQAVRCNNYKSSYNHTETDMNLFPMWEEIPGPVPSLTEAKQIDFARYQLYRDKVTIMKKNLDNMIQQYLSDHHINIESMSKDSKAMADKNTLVQQMGGSEALMKMSEKERKEVAQKVATNIKNNPGAFSGINNEGMNDMAQRMMNDPKYREAYSKMTDDEKESELKKYMGNTVEERNDKAFESTFNDRNISYSNANIELLLGKTLLQIQEAAKPYTEGTELANSLYNDVYERLETWYKKVYASLPETNTREKIGLDKLIKCKETILYGFHKNEASTRTILWNLLKSNTKIAFGEFNDFVGYYPWGKSNNASPNESTYTEPKVAQAVNSIYDEMIRMTNEAEQTTSYIKGYQEQYDLIVN